MMVDVSRETPPEPDAAVVTQVFAPGRLDVLRRYAALLASEGVVRGLIGPREVARLWDRHLLNCGLLAPLVPEGARVADLGSGAGLPGLVLALARPDLEVTLIEPMARRTAFLEEACALLGADRVTVVRGRAEDLAGAAELFDVVTARALAPLPRLLAWAMPLVTPGGCLLAMKGSAAAHEVAGARSELTGWHSDAEVVRCAVPGASPTNVVRVVRSDAPAIGWQATATARRRRRERT
ncbi:MAG: 16S rRNA (guanine(527)-N(7))-methyltransferase RsmG [Nocardioides sp.]